MENAWINGSQMTVTLYANDLKISHKGAAEVTRLIDYLEGIYEDMAVQRGKNPKYLGMELDYSSDGEVTITINSYIKEDLEEFP